MESGTGGGAYGDGVGAELARLREALDDLRRRPIPLDVATLRHVVTASLAEASAPPPNLLVTAIRRLDRVDARLETIEALLGGPAALPRGGPPQGPSGHGRGRSAAVSAPAPLPMPTQYAAPPDAEAIAEALARRLGGVLSQTTAVPGGGGATVEDLIAAVRPLVPGAARAVLRRAGREPSPQAVEVLQQTALHALVDAADSLGPFAPSASAYAAPLEPSRFSPPPALAPAPPPSRAAAPPSQLLDLDALAATIAARVADAVVATLASPVAPPPRPPVEEPARRPPERPGPPPPAFDPGVVAEAVIRRLAQQPPPPAVVSPMAMAPLLSAVGNVEAAVAQLAEPDGGVVVAVDRLEAGVEALARALEEDRSAQADEVRRGFAELTSLLRAGPPAQPLSPDSGGEDGADRAGAAPPADQGDPGPVDPSASSPGVFGDVAGIHRRLDRLTEQLAPLAESDLATAVPALATQNQRVERSLGNILTALAALAEHLHEQTAAWQAGFDGLGASLAANGPPPGPVDLTPLQHDLRGLADRLDDLVPGTAADRQRFQRLGGTIDGLAQLLGQVSERLDRLPRLAQTDARSAPGRTGDDGPDSLADGEEPPVEAVAVPVGGPDVERIAEVATPASRDGGGASEVNDRTDSSEGRDADPEPGETLEGLEGAAGVEGGVGTATVEGGFGSFAGSGDGEEGEGFPSVVAGAGVGDLDYDGDGEGVSSLDHGGESGGIETTAGGGVDEGIGSAADSGDGERAESVAEDGAGDGVGSLDDGVEGGGSETIAVGAEGGGAESAADGGDGEGRGSADQVGDGENAESIGAEGRDGDGVGGFAAGGVGAGVGSFDDGRKVGDVESTAVGAEGEGRGSADEGGDGESAGSIAEGGAGEGVDSPDDGGEGVAVGLGTEGRESADEGGDGESAGSIAEGGAGEGVDGPDDAGEGGGVEGVTVGLGAEGRGSADEDGDGDSAESIRAGRGNGEGVDSFNDDGEVPGVEGVAGGMGAEGGDSAAGGESRTAESVAEDRDGEGIESIAGTDDLGGTELDHDEDLEDVAGGGEAEERGDQVASRAAVSADGLDAAGRLEVGERWFPDAAEDAPGPSAERWSGVGSGAADHLDVGGAGHDGAVEEAWPGDPDDAPSRLGPADSRPGADQAGPADVAAEIARADEGAGLDDHAVVPAAEPNGAGGEEVSGRRGRGRRRRGKRRG